MDISPPSSQSAGPAVQVKIVKGSSEQLEKVSAIILDSIKEPGKGKHMDIKV